MSVIHKILEGIFIAQIFLFQSSGDLLEILLILSFNFILDVSLKSP